MYEVTYRAEFDTRELDSKNTHEVKFQFDEHTPIWKILANYKIFLISMGFFPPLVEQLINFNPLTKVPGKNNDERFEELGSYGSIEDMREFKEQIDNNPEFLEMVWNIFMESMEDD